MSQRHWQEFWNHYDGTLDGHPELIDTIKSLFDVQGKKILEIGAGRGFDSIALANEGALVYALDSSLAALELIEKNARDAKVRVNLVDANAGKLPFADGFFDLVFHQGFLEHFVEPKTYLAEQKRVLKRNGYLVIDVPQKYNPYTLKKHYYIRRKQWYASWETQYTIGELNTLLRQLGGFKLIDSYGSYMWLGYPQAIVYLRNLHLHGIQRRGKPWLPEKAAELYNTFWERIERFLEQTKILYWCVGVVAQKEQ